MRMMVCLVFSSVLVKDCAQLGLSIQTSPVSKHRTIVRGSSVLMSLNLDDEMLRDDGTTLKITELAPQQFRLRACKGDDIMFVAWVELRAVENTVNNRVFRNKFGMLGTYTAPVVYVYTGEAVQFDRKDKSVATTIITSTRLENYVARKTVNIEQQDGCGNCIFVDNRPFNHPEEKGQVSYLFPLNQ